MAFPVAVVQMSVEPGEVEENRHVALNSAVSAIERGARIVLLPEACISDIYRGAQALAELIPGPTTALAASIAGDAIIALPLLEKSPDGKVFSACALVARDGIRGVARKSHLYRDATGQDLYRDEDTVTAGDALSIFDLGEIRVGVLLGFDAEFPESFRTLALRGADLILVALNCVEPDAGFLSAMASHNRVPLAVANRIGFRRIYPGTPETSAASMPILQEKDGTFIMRCKGRSVILDAGGRIAAEPARAESENPAPDAPAAVRVPSGHFQEEEVLSASFKIDELRVQRLTSPFFAQRRAALYQS